MVKLRFDRIQNNHKIFKKHQKNGKPLHMFLVCHILTTPIDKQGLDAFKKICLNVVWNLKSQTMNSHVWRDVVLDLQHEIYKKNSPKFHFGVTKKDPGLLFHFHGSNLFKCWSNLGLTEFKIIIKYSKKSKKWKNLRT